jgi:hypothetical protein
MSGEYLHRIGGSAGSVDGQRVGRSTRDAIRRTDRAKLAKVSTDAQALLTPEVVRQFIESQTCPWCGRGPFEVLASHTRTHGYGRKELRALAGLALHDSICSKSVSDHRREAMRSRPDLADQIARMVAAANISERKARTARTPERQDHLARIRPAAYAAFAQRAANEAKVRRAELLASFARHGTDWDAVIALAAELGKGVRQTAEQLRIAGAELPDGRVASRLRLEGRRQRPSRPKVPCRFPGCDRDSIRRGCCDTHRRFAYAVQPDGPS